jgi:hypothetical protein
MATKKTAKNRAPAKSKSGGRASRRKASPQDEQAMMAAWQKSMTPGAGHARLGPMVGLWTTRTTMTMNPGAPPQVSEGVSEHRLILGGRYLEQSYRGTAMGMPFEGRGYTAFDNVRGCYVGTWMDTFGTGMMHSVGVGRPSDAKIDFESESYDPSGKRVRFDCRIRMRDRDHHSYEMWTKDPRGRRYRVMLVEYTRS